VGHLADDYYVAKIEAKRGKEFVKEHHYSHGIHNGPMCYGLLEIGTDRLVGVCAFATPSSEAVCASVFGVEYKRSVTELHRLVLLDEVRHNAESFFISRAMKLLKQDRPYYSAVLSFADSTQGHRGTIYRATNALYCGMTGRSRFYYDETGRLRHPRQNGVNITLQMAKERGWTGVMREAKFRYLFILPTSKTERKTWRSRLLLAPLPYPQEALVEYEVAA
jgi:hypothetical protein